MPAVTLRFYEELNAFLPPARRKVAFAVQAPPGATAKSVIEDQGVPHTEVDLLLVNGVSVGFSHRLQEGDRVSVYPVFEAWDITGVSRVRPTPLREPRFALDVHLGTLARLLRMMGFDASWDRDLDDEGLVRGAVREKRIVLSRDRGLLKRRLVTHGYLVRSLVPRDQAAEVVHRFDLAGAVRPFGRCLRCNVPLLPLSREEARPRVPAAVAGLYTEFHACPSCGRTYWKGSHWDRLAALARAIVDAARDAGDATISS